MKSGLSSQLEKVKSVSDVSQKTAHTVLLPRAFRGRLSLILPYLPQSIHECQSTPVNSWIEFPSLSPVHNLFIKCKLKKKIKKLPT